MFEIGVFSLLKRIFVSPFWNCFHRICSAIWSKVGCCNKDQTLNIMSGINAVDTEAVLRIVDQDPEEEAKRVQKLSENDLQIKISNVSKSYNIHKKAVNDLTFGLEPGECFALLGVTGAGKTSTFKCITGEETPDAGSLHLGGHDVCSFFGQNKAHCLIGYCP